MGKEASLLIWIPCLYEGDDQDFSWDFYRILVRTSENFCIVDPVSSPWLEVASIQMNEDDVVDGERSNSSDLNPLLTKDTVTRAALVTNMLEFKETR